MHRSDAEAGDLPLFEKKVYNTKINILWKDIVIDISNRHSIRSNDNVIPVEETYPQETVLQMNIAIFVHSK